jgi:hypothetical protein
LHVLDEQADKKHMWIRPRLEMKPSEFFCRQGAITISDDPIALRCLDLIGAETLFWGSDYPLTRAPFRTARRSSPNHLPMSGRPTNAKSSSTTHAGFMVLTLERHSWMTTAIILYFATSVWKQAYQLLLPAHPTFLNPYRPARPTALLAYKPVTPQ